MTTESNTAAPAADAQTAIAISALPAIGAALCGGAFAGITTRKDGTHVAIALLASKPDKRLEWKDAKAWAEGLDAELPTRPVAALLYANAKAQFESDWYWTADSLDADTGRKSDASYAWHCTVYDGYQSDLHKSYEGLAVAVRLIPLVA